MSNINYTDEEKITELCKNYDLGDLVRSPEIVAGGLLHMMYHVSTDQGEYAIKLLNPDIMKRTEALQNMINSEMISNALVNVIPLVAAKSFNGENILELDGYFYVIFDWLVGETIFPPNITECHCEQIGRALGKIHASKIKVDTMEANLGVREVYDWNMLLEKAKICNEDVYLILQDNFADIIRWDRNAVSGLHSALKNQVISHRDLDPKNVMWKNDEPFIIDWEAAGYVNPFQELIEVLNYWIADEAGKYDKVKFDALMHAYTESIDVNNVNWEVVQACSFDGMLGWLEYSLKRALGIEGADINEPQEGLHQTKSTIQELKKYENQIEQLKAWIDDYVK